MTKWLTNQSSEYRQKNIFKKILYDQFKIITCTISINEVKRKDVEKTGRPTSRS